MIQPLTTSHDSVITTRLIVIFHKKSSDKDAVKAMKSEVEMLDALNKELVPPDLANDNRETEEDYAATKLTGWPEVPRPVNLLATLPVRFLQSYPVKF
jgi:hypothetical protein